MNNPFEHGYYPTEELLEFGFKKVGSNVKIAKNCTLIGLENISIGDNVQIDGNVSIICCRGFLSLGNHIHISAGCYFSCVGGVTLEDFCGLGYGVVIYSGSDDYGGKGLTNPTIPSQFRSEIIAPVNLGRHVIVGTSCVILPGVNIGEGSSVGALSLITKDLEDWGVYFGAPAKKKKNRSKDLLEKEKELKKNERPQFSA